MLLNVIKRYGDSDFVIQNSFKKHVNYYFVNSFIINCSQYLINDIIFPIVSTILLKKQLIFKIFVNILFASWFN